jgi:acetyl-CoA carboxylase biotin carboxylase subunit
MFHKVLIANRGEIAVRVARALREMGIRSVAVFSDVDRTALHVQMADEAVSLGAPEPTASYLAQEKIIEAAKRMGAEAIHPGYGFLAENPDFAKRCGDEGLVFIGPGHEEIRFLGNKLLSREKVGAMGVPIIPGMVGKGSSTEEIVREAERMGFPVLIKAAAGGGGKGMRVVRGRELLAESLEGAMREAGSAFGDSTVYLEKYLEEPRHIEFQILADQKGNVIHLFERECSVQRRHQKIVEESPSMALTPKRHRAMAEAAVAVVRAVGYRSAGTVEFLVDTSGDFYFLEVNTRIQVEHPVTELLLGVDLVKEQIKISSGLPLSLSQDSLSPRGHAIECRIYAEDPENDFLPSFGRITHLTEPKGPGVRVDSGVYAGCEVPMYYDPILSKVIVWGEDRESARARMRRALLEYRLTGVKTTIDFLRDLMDEAEFAGGRTTTALIPGFLPLWKEMRKERSHLAEALIAAAIDASRDGGPMRSGARPEVSVRTPWDRLGAWRIFGGSEESRGRRGGDA